MKKEIKAIYSQSFGFEDAFFEKLYKFAGKNCKTLIKNGKIVSFLFLLPIKIIHSKNAINSYYLFAAATSPDCRKLGYMSELINSITSSTDIPIILCPASEYLVNFYKKLGFSSFNATYKENKDFCILPTDEFLQINEKDEQTQGEYTLMCFSKENLDLNGISFKYTMR